jgi:hypothetical protein
VSPEIAERAFEEAIGLKDSGCKFRLAYFRELLQQYADDRQRLVARLRTLSSEGWNRSAEHGEYTHYSVFIMFRHLALHDFFHAYRIEELLLKKDWSGSVGDPGSTTKPGSEAS